MLIDIKIREICSDNSRQWPFNGRLKIYVDPKKVTLTHSVKSVSPKWLDIFA